MTKFETIVNSLSKLYDLDVNTVRIRLTDLGHRLNFKKAGSDTIDEEFSLWTQIEAALKMRKEKAPEAIESIHKLLSCESLMPELTKRMGQLQNEFIALFAAHKIEGASYHFYGHGVEMSQDPGSFLRRLLPESSTFNPFIEATTNALGAAHDIIQGKPNPPTNEQKSAELFIEKTQEMIENFIREFSSTLTTSELSALTDFKNQGIPFLAQECIVNATYLLFNAGKRDFDNVLFQTQKTLGYDPTRDLDSLTAGMKMSMALADTRRSEMKHILLKLEVLNKIPEEQLPNLEIFLKRIGLITAEETIKQLKDKHDDNKLMQIEGFLLRIGQNIRMSAELGVVLLKPSATTEEREKARGRIDFISDIRAHKHDFPGVNLSLEKHLIPFLNSIKGPFGEAAFAKALGTIDTHELRHQAVAYGLTLREEDFDYSGWTQHSADLLKTEKFFLTAPDLDPISIETKKSIAQILYTLAAKSPGHHVSTEVYEAMIALMKHYKKTEADPDLIANIEHEIKEIESANPSLKAAQIKKSLQLVKLVEVGHKPEDNNEGRPSPI